MHKGVILLMKAESKEEAEGLAEEFMSDHCSDHGVCDWYEIGGRWAGELGNDENIRPLSECIDIVKEWWKDPEAEAEKLKKTMEEHYPNDRSMQGYFLIRQGHLLCQDFCFDTNVYNLEEYNYSIPEDNIGEWFAVMVDMHN